MKQNFIQLDFMDINDAPVGKNIIVRFINKDGKHTEFVHLQELHNLVDDVNSFITTYQSRYTASKVHAGTRKRRLVNRLIRKVNKLTAEGQYWRKRAKKLASGAIEVEDDAPPTKSVWQSPPDTIRKNLLVCLINNISGERSYQVVRNVSMIKILMDVASPVAGCIIPFEWNGTMYVSATKDEDGQPIYRLEI